MATAYFLYLVKHPLGEFIAVAACQDDLQEHFGTAAVFELIEDERTVLDLRAKGPERVFLAI